MKKGDAKPLPLYSKIDEIYFKESTIDLKASG